MVCDSWVAEAPLAENPHSVMRGVSHSHLRVEEMVAQLKSLELASPIDERPLSLFQGSVSEWSDMRSY